MDKPQIRRYIRDLRGKITESMRVDASNYILSQIESTDLFKSSRTIALYYALGDEVPTAEWCERWLELGKRVVLPRVEGDDMEFFDYLKESLRCGSFSIMEPHDGVAVQPSEIDLIIVPGVAFTSDGSRIGRGKGYYDRYLSRFGFRAKSIGVGFAHQLLDVIPCEAHDRRLDFIITAPMMLPLSAVIQRVVESAWGDADRIGCGVERLNAMGLSWVLLRYRMELIRMPKADEELSVETWICDCRRVVSSRYFVVRDAAGELVGEAISQWCMIDLKSRRPTDLTRSEINYAQHIKSRKVSIALSSKLSPMDIETGQFQSRTHVANECDIDFNRHVNTFRYIDMMVGMLPSETINISGASVVDLQFIHESYLGDELTIRHMLNVSPSAQRSQFEILRHDQSVAVRGELELRR